MTRDGATVGTFDYISPEQARHSHSVDTRSDIYSLGCTLYHMLAGQVPFPAPSLMEKLLAHQTGVPEPLEGRVPGLPEGLSDVVRRMMQKSPADRYPTPLAVAQALEPFAFGLAPTLDGEVDGVLGQGAGGRRPVTSRTKITPPPGVPEPDAGATEVPETQTGTALDNEVSRRWSSWRTRVPTRRMTSCCAGPAAGFPPPTSLAGGRQGQGRPDARHLLAPDRRLAIGLAGALLAATLGFLGFVVSGKPVGQSTTTDTPPPESTLPGPPKSEPKGISRPGRRWDDDPRARPLRRHATGDREQGGRS